MADYASLLRDHVTANCRSIDRILDLAAPAGAQQSSHGKP